MEGFFQDAQYLYMVLEYVVGGELYFVLKKKKKFSNADSRFYGGQIVSAIEYMHRKDIIYRDLKPENMLIDSDGYLKITDFGFAKVMKANERTWTLCGTPEYLAPEIITKAGHSKPADWWSVGICLFELLSGVMPFPWKDDLDAFAKVVTKAKYKMPGSFEKDAKDLIKRLLEPDPKKRLGCQVAGPKDILQHNWFTKCGKKFDWRSLAGRTLVPPWVPTAKNTAETSNFSKSGQDENGANVVDSPLSSKDDEPFLAFGNYALESNDACD